MDLVNMFKMYQGLPRSIYILFIVRIINSMGNFVYPLLTLLLTGKLGFTSKEAGAFLSLAAVAYVPGALIGGKITDMFGRKKIIIVFQSLAAICFIPCAFLGKSMLIPWLLIISGVFNSIVQPANSAMIADLTNKDNRKAAFSLLYLGINIGFSIGPVIAGFLYKNHLMWVFLGNVIASFITITLVALYVEEGQAHKEKEDEEEEEIPEEERAQEGNAIKLLLQRPRLLAFALLSTIYTFAYSQGNFSTTLQLKSLFGDNASKMLGGVQATNGLTVIFMTTLIIYLTRKKKPILNIAISGVFFATGFGIQYFISRYPLFIIATFIWTVGEIISSTNSGVYIANNAPLTHRGRFNSILTMITGAGSAIGPLVAGSFIDSFGVRSVWPVVFSITMLASFFMYLLYKTEKQ